LFILFASISILYQAIERILNQKALENSTEGLILITVSAVVNLSLAYFLYKKARSLNSSILFSHATHIFTKTSLSSLLDTQVENVLSYLSVKDAHNLCDEIEREIKTIFPEIEVIIHVEPSP
jgi:divalent metal cation (Fe/Co/Zn/Cd) transporter